MAVKENVFGSNIKWRELTNPLREDVDTTNKDHNFNHHLLHHCLNPALLSK